MGNAYATALSAEGAATIADVAEMEPTQLRPARPFIPLEVTLDHDYVRHVTVSRLVVGGVEERLQ